MDVRAYRPCYLNYCSVFSFRLFLFRQVPCTSPGRQSSPSTGLPSPATPPSTARVVGCTAPSVWPRSTSPSSRQTTPFGVEVGTNTTHRTCLVLHSSIVFFENGSRKQLGLRTTMQYLSRSGPPLKSQKSHGRTSLRWLAGLSASPAYA